MVVMVPAGVISSTSLLPVSAINKLFDASMATPLGAFNCAAPPVPAKVLITPAGVTIRMRLLDVSAMYQLPFESTAMPEGEYSCAAVAGPPSPPKYGAVPLPARVVRMPPLGISDTNAPDVRKMSPEGSMVTSLADATPGIGWTTVPK